MLYSKGFITTQKNNIHKYDSISQELIHRAGIAYQSTSGHYTILPIGKRVLKKIESVIRQELDDIGAVELTMPIMQPASLWQESGRWNVYGEEMYKLKNRSGRDFCLGPTHEELVVDIVKKNVHSYKELPLTLYQIGTKFRDEMRPRNGLIRAKEFVMKDAYSFDIDGEGLNNSYQHVRDVYTKIFKRLNLKVDIVNANVGEMGGSFSEEFIACVDSKEDAFNVKKNKKNESTSFTEDKNLDIEVGHIFKLGTRYSEAMNLKLIDANGVSTPLMMGCYGIGVSRILPTLIEQHHDSKGIIWPKSVAPFDVEILPIRYDLANVREQSLNLYSALKNTKLDILFDDRGTGNKFKDSDLLGIPYKIIVSTKTLERDCVELEDRKTGEKNDIRLSDVRNIENILLSNNS